jgi:hypothetical protein
MINIFDPGALIVRGEALEAKEEFHRWFIGESRADGYTMGARSAAIEARKLARQNGVM